MEHLLVQCANAIETNNATQAQQILWVLNNTTPQEGDSNQRLAASFIRALTTRILAKTGCCKMLEQEATQTANSYNNINNHSNLPIQTHKFSVIELASFVDLTPWHRFGYTAANSAILEATKGFSVIHIVDLSLTNCMQIPTLIDAIANRDVVPPSIKLTVAVRNRNVHFPIPPLLDLSYDELGWKLVNFAKSRNVCMEFKAVSSTYADGFASLIEHLRVQVQDFVYNKTHEALVINCHMMLHYIPEETLYTVNDMNMNTKSSSLRSMFLEALRSLEPTIVVLVDEDADLTSSDLVTRLRSAFNYLWIPFDAVDTFLPRGSKERHWYESDICWKIENVIAYEGIQRVERVESKSKWEQRMRNANFQGVCFSEDSVMEVKGMIDEHAVGWGLKKEDEFLLLTWKGHNVIFASAWLPC